MNRPRLRLAPIKQTLSQSPNACCGQNANNYFNNNETINRDILAVGAGSCPGCLSSAAGSTPVLVNAGGTSHSTPVVGQQRALGSVLTAIVRLLYVANPSCCSAATAVTAGRQLLCDSLAFLSSSALEHIHHFKPSAASAAAASAQSPTSLEDGQACSGYACGRLQR